MKSFLSSIAALTLLVTISVAQDVEPNNTIATASPAPLNTPFNGTLGIPSTDTDDYFIVDLPSTGNVTATATLAAGLSGTVRIYRNTGTLINSSSTGTGLLSVTENCLGSPQIIIRVQRSSGSGTYTLEINLAVPPLPADAEPNNSATTTILTVGENESFTGQIGYSNNGVIDSDDYFMYNSPRNGSVTFSVVADPALTYTLRIYRPSGALMTSGTIGSGANSVTLACLQAGTYVGRVDRSSGCGSYTGSFSTTTLSHANDVEPNNSAAQATEIFNENQVFTGQIGHMNNAGATDSDDYFIYNNPRNGDITFTVNADPELSYTVRLYRPSGTLLSSGTLGSGVRSVTLSCAQAGNFVGRVDRSGGCGSYTAFFSTSNLTHPADVEPNNSTSSAVFTTTKKFNYGQLGYISNAGITDSDDYYAIKITQAPLTLSVPFRFEETLSGVLRIYNAGGSLLASSSSTAPGIDNTLNYTFNTAGVYFIRVDRSSGCGSYRFGEPCPSGLDVDNDNICDTEDTCLVNGGWIQTSSTLTGICPGDGFPNPVQVTVAGKTGQGLFGLVTFPALDVVATNTTGLFNMDLYPGGQYRIGHVAVPSLIALQGITNANQLSGCYDLSNLIAVTTTALIPGTLSANDGTTACGDDGIPSNLSFSITGAVGPGFRYAVLTQDFSTVLASNTVGSFNFDAFGPGNYRVVYAVYTGVNPATINPSNLPPCVRISNVINITITSCAPSMLVQPNPTAGESNVSFIAQSDAWHTLEVYDMQGRLLKSLMNQVTQAGQEYRFSFDGSALPNGVYLYRLTTESDVRVEKFMIAR